MNAVFDGELPSDEAARVRAQIEADPAARRELLALAAVDKALEALPGATARADFAARVLRRARSPAPLLRLVLPLAAAAAALLLALLPPLGETGPSEPVATEEPQEYFWEADVDTYGSLALRDLKQEVLAELDAS
ncbi:MAG: hypothetical protein ACT4PV_05630 [Planctomycetaceae bacterium]